MSRCFVHIGAHKTATSTLQGFFSGLARLGPAQTGLFYDLGGTSLARRLRDGSPSPAELAELRQQVAAVHAAQPRLPALLSSEEFLGRPAVAYADAGEVAGRLAAVLAGRPVGILVMVRRQDTFLESWYGHLVRREGLGLEFPAFLAAWRSRELFWDAILDQWAAHFGAANLLVLPYEEFSRDNLGGLTRLMRALGLNLRFENLDGLPRANAGYAAKAVEMARRVNPLLTPAEREKLREFLEREFPKAPGERYDFFPPGGREELLAHYAEANRRLFAQYLPGRDPAYYLGQKPARE
ncbi:MAG: hypothetical protein KQJ78_16285 [Deltaproteobacteria bacterium]|nr:hypothetical protein [Deltaproteobacteria bacterium]